MNPAPTCLHYSATFYNNNKILTSVRPNVYFCAVLSVVHTSTDIQRKKRNTATGKLTEVIESHFAYEDLETQLKSLLSRL